jgi:hypothetical protein
VNVKVRSAIAHAGATLRGTLLDGVLLLVHGSTKPTIEPSAFSGATVEHAARASRMRRWPKLAALMTDVAQKRKRASRKVSKLWRHPDRFFADSRLPIVRRLGRFVRRP